MTSACLDKAKIRVSSVPGNLGSQQTMNFTLTMLEALITYIFPFLSCSQINDYLGYLRALFSQECAGFLVLPSVLKNMFGFGLPCFSLWGPCQFLFCFFFFFFHPCYSIQHDVGCCKHHRDLCDWSAFGKKVL